MSSHNSHTLQVGTVIEDKWIILEFIGKGGMGEVYRAHQLNLKRDVAFKIISRERLDSIEKNQEELEIGIQRFRNEVLAMAQVRHPNILQIYDYSSFSVQKGPDTLNFDYIVMEYIPGGTLRSTMSEDGLYPEESLIKDWVLRYFLPVLDGVQALHTAGIIHRDLKPGNILMDGNTPRITDFGLARSSRIRPVTMSMDIKGTPAYMSPEHFMDLKRADSRSDIYSLGKILYEAIDGKISPDTIPLKCANLRRIESPFFERFNNIIRTATAEDKNHRYNSVEAFRNVIFEAVRIEEPRKIMGKSVKHGMIELISRSNWIWGGIALAVILVMAMTLWYLFGQPGGLTRIPEGSPPSLSETETPGHLESNAVKDKVTPLPPDLTGKDGAKLYLIAGGDLLLPIEIIKEPGEPVKIDPFYMDETEVTNHQYAEFLNKIISNVHIEEEVVSVDGDVYLLLGEVTKGYEPIIFKDGKFMVKDPIYHSHPVVRVTALGAEAYGKYYGRRLPTASEWIYASKTENSIVGTSPASAQETVDSHMEIMHGQEQITPPGNQNLSESPVSVTEAPPNQYGIRGLDGNVAEWGTIIPIVPSQRSKESKYGVFPGAIGRLPWEASKDVGFRTVLSIAKQK